jgi:DNA-binding PadR family transcriptional regulator
MSAQLTPLAIAALGLLNERPMHPYEMYQLLITRTEDRLVKVRPGSLYHTIDRMTLEGHIEPVGTDREGNRPERTTYRITESGQLALSERITEIIASPVNEYPEFPLGVAEAHNLSKGVLVELLGRRRVQLISDLDRLSGGLTDVRAKAVPQKFWLDITYQKAMVSAEIAWLDGLVKDLESGTLEWDSEPSQKETTHDQRHTH